MRLICPNCGAQYEIPEAVIPEAGRDVQCSDCGTTWFQHHPNFVPDTAAEAVADTDPDAEDLTTQAQDDYGADEQIEDTVVSPPSQEKSTLGDNPTSTFQRRELDPTVSDVLREEAHRETQARESDRRGGIETQQEFSLEEETDEEVELRTQEAQARMARLRGVSEPDPVEDEFDDIDPGSRSNLLPDIDEINSSLAPETVREEQSVPEPSLPIVPMVRPSGFRSGFRLAIILAVLGFMIYVFAPQISSTVPFASGPLEIFVDAVNSGRASLNNMLQGWASALTPSDTVGS